MTLQTSVRDVEDFSVGTLEVLARHRLATLGDVLRWVPDGSVHSSSTTSPPSSKTWATAGRRRPFINGRCDRGGLQAV